MMDLRVTKIRVRFEEWARYLLSKLCFFENTPELRLVADLTSGLGSEMGCVSLWLKEGSWERTAFLWPEETR